jgi:phage shock protein PspC (stress-responsive transcriptional regulator)
MSSIWTIRRSATDSKLTGLCGGVARHWGVDPVLIRVGCVLLALSGGIGVVLYLAGWLFIPVDGSSEAVVDHKLPVQPRKWPRPVWIMVVALSCFLVFGVVTTFTPFGFGPAGVLALIWYFGYYKNRERRRHDPAGPIPAAGVRRPGDVPPQPQFFSYPGPPTPFTEAAHAWRQRIEEAQRAAQPPATYLGSYDHQPSVMYEDVREPVGPASSLPLAAPLGPESVEYNAFLATPDPAGIYVEGESRDVGPVPARPSRATAPSAKRLRLVSLVVLGLTLSGLGIADSLGGKIPLTAYFAASLLVLGLTLVAAAWLGRARGVLAVALLVLVATVGTTVGGQLLLHDQHVSTRQLTYTSIAQLAPRDNLDVGALKVDLTGLAMKSNTTYAAHVRFGSLEVSAPMNVNLVVNYRVKLGAVIVNGHESESGSDVNGVLPPIHPDPRKTTLTLHLAVDTGVVQVNR